MLNFVGDCDGDGNDVGTYKQTLIHDNVQVYPAVREVTTRKKSRQNELMFTM